MNPAPAGSRTYVVSPLVLAAQPCGTASRNPALVPALAGDSEYQSKPGGKVTVAALPGLAAPAGPEAWPVGAAAAPGAYGRGWVQAMAERESAEKPAATITRAAHAVGSSRPPREAGRPVRAWPGRAGRREVHAPWRPSVGERR